MKQMVPLAQNELLRIEWEAHEDVVSLPIKESTRSAQRPISITVRMSLANQNVRIYEQVIGPPSGWWWWGRSAAEAVGKWESRGVCGISKRWGKPVFGFPRSGFSVSHS
jgi:hypothetical protein